MPDSFLVIDDSKLVHQMYRLIFSRGTLAGSTVHYANNGREGYALLAAHPGLTLLADDRELLASLIYYVRPHPFGAVEWNPIPGITDQWRLANNIGTHKGEDFLAVTTHGLEELMRPDFAELTPLTTIATHSGPGGGTAYTVYIARGFKGDGRQHR